MKLLIKTRLTVNLDKPGNRNLENIRDVPIYDQNWEEYSSVLIKEQTLKALYGVCMTQGYQLDHLMSLRLFL